jgi:hypothetical protein
VIHYGAKVVKSKLRYTIVEKYSDLADLGLMFCHMSFHSCNCPGKSRRCSHFANDEIDTQAKFGTLRLFAEPGFHTSSI